MANPFISRQPGRETQQSSSVQLARRLLDHDTAPGTNDPEVASVGLRKTCARINSSLRNALGGDAADALLVRALTRIEAQHPLIADFRRSSEGNISFDALVQSVDRHGVGPVTVAIEALLAALIDILARLIGEDMTVRLIAADVPPLPPTNGGGPTS